MSILGPLLFYSLIATGDLVTTHRVKGLEIKFAGGTIRGEERNPLMQNSFTHIATWAGTVTLCTYMDHKLEKAGKKKTLWTLRGMFFLGGGFLAYKNEQNRREILRGVK